MAAQDADGNRVVREAILAPGGSTQQVGSTGKGVGGDQDAALLLALEQRRPGLLGPSAGRAAECGRQAAWLHMKCPMTHPQHPDNSARWCTPSTWPSSGWG